MKNVLNRIAKALTKALKAITKALKSSAAFLFGNGNGGVAMASADNDADEPDAPEADGPDMGEAFALDRKAKGLEPQDIKTFALEQDMAKREKFAAKNMTSKTRTWALSLGDKERGILATAHEQAIERHMAGVGHIAGVTMAPRMFGSHRPDTTRQIVNDLKHEDKATDLVFHGKELDRVTAYAKPAKATFGQKELPKPSGALAIKRPMPTPSGSLKAKGTSMTMTYKPPMPPASMFPAAMGA